MKYPTKHQDHVVTCDVCKERPSDVRVEPVQDLPMKTRRIKASNFCALCWWQCDIQCDSLEPARIRKWLEGMARSQALELEASAADALQEVYSRIHGLLNGTGGLQPMCDCEMKVGEMFGPVLDYLGVKMREMGRIPDEDRDDLHSGEEK